MDQILGVQALIGMIVNLVFIIITWWALSALRFEKLFKNGKTMQIRVLYVLVTIAIAHLASDFFLTYFDYTQNLKLFFQ